jgi:hypothetical protein
MAPSIRHASRGWRAHPAIAGETCSNRHTRRTMRFASTTDGLLAFPAGFSGVLAGGSASPQRQR